MIGDFDSVSPDLATQMPGTRFVEAADQEMCDLEKAILYAIERDAERITLTGCLGRRLDHTLTALSLLIAYHPRCEIRIVCDYCEAFVAEHWTQVSGEPGDTLSLVTFAPAEGVSVHGVRWPMNDERLLPGSRGVSNEMVLPVARVSVRQGVVIVIHQRQTQGEPA